MAWAPYRLRNTCKTIPGCPFSKWQPRLLRSNGKVTCLCDPMRSSKVKVSCLRCHKATQRHSHSWSFVRILQDDEWRKALDALTNDIDGKLDRMEFGPIRDELERQLRALAKKLNAVHYPLDPNEDDAAGIRRCVMCTIKCIPWNEQFITMSTFVGALGYINTFTLTGSSS